MGRARGYTALVLLAANSEQLSACLLNLRTRHCGETCFMLLRVLLSTVARVSPPSLPLFFCLITCPCSYAFSGCPLSCVCVVCCKQLCFARTDASTRCPTSSRTSPLSCAPTASRSRSLSHALRVHVRLQNVHGYMFVCMCVSRPVRTCCVRRLCPTHILIRIFRVSG